MKLRCPLIKRVLGLLVCSFLFSDIFAQSLYDGWDKTEAVLTYPDFSGITVCHTIYIQEGCDLASAIKLV